MQRCFKFRRFKLTLKTAFLLAIFPLGITKATEKNDGVTYGVSGDFPLSSVLVDNDDCPGSGLNRIKKFIESGAELVVSLKGTTKSHISAHTEKRLERLRNMLGVLPRTDYKMDEFEKVAVDNIISTLDHFSRLLNPLHSIFSSFHISLCQDALTVQVYHLLRYRYEQGKKYLYFNDFLQKKGVNCSFKDFERVLFEKIKMQQNPHFQTALAENLEALATKTWMWRLNVLVKDHFSSHPGSLGSFLDERDITGLPVLSKIPLYEDVLAELISEHSPALSQIYLNNRDEVREKLDGYGRNLRLRRQYGHISQMLIKILEPMEDIASLEFDQFTLVDQIPLVMNADGYLDIMDAISRDADKPYKFTTIYFLRRLYVLGKGMMDFFPKIYFQRDGGGAIPKTLRDALYQYIPFKLSRNIALNMHHAGMFKREDDIEHVKKDMVAIRDFMKDIVPYVKEYIACELSDTLDQPYVGVFQHKEAQEVKDELEKIVQTYPSLQKLGDFPIDLGYLFISYNTVGNILERLPPPPTPLTHWSRIQRDGFYRALSILGETAKNISTKVKDTIPNKEILRLFEVFRDEFSHYNGRGKKLPLRFNALFSDDTHGNLIYNALTDIQAIHQYFNSYNKALWENTLFPSTPHIQGHLMSLMGTVSKLNYPPSLPEESPFLIIPKGANLKPDLKPLRATFDVRDDRLEKMLEHLRLETQKNPIVLNEQIKAIESSFPLGSDMGDHTIVRKIKELVKTQKTITSCGEELLKHLSAVQAQHADSEFQEIKDYISKESEIPEHLLPRAHQIFQGKIIHRLQSYQKAFPNKQILEQKIRELVSSFSIEKEFEGFLSNFLINQNIKKKYDIEQKRDGDGDVAAVKFLQNCISRFGITDWEPWAQDFRKKYGLTPETELRKELERARVMAKGLVRSFRELEPIVSELKSITTEFLHWQSVEYNLLQLRDFIEEIDSSIRKIRSINPGLLRNIEYQLLKLRLMGNHFAHLNDVINFDKYNIGTQHRDINLILQSIYGFNKEPIAQICLLDALNIFIIDIERLLNSSDGMLLHQQLPLPFYNATRRWTAPERSGGTFVLQERDIARDDDCGFRVLKGLTREKGVALLLKNINDLGIRRAVAEDIRISFLAGQFVEDKALGKLKREFYKRQTEIDILRRQIVGIALPINNTPADISILTQLAKQEATSGMDERAELLTKLGEVILKLDTVNIKINEYTNNTITYRDFIDREFRNGNGWLSYIRNGKGCLYALAKIMGLNVKIWEPDLNDPGKLKLIPIASGLRGNVIHILHTDRLTHFNSLDIFKKD